MKRLFACLCLFTAFMLWVPKVQAGEIQDLLKRSEPFYPLYGSTPLKIGPKEALVIRGLHQTESASSGDVYTFLVRDKAVWQFVYRDEPQDRSPLFSSQPHTYEDSLVSLRFFMSSNLTPSFYILQATRDLGGVVRGDIPASSRSSRVAFALFQLVYDDGFGIYSFKKIKDEKTTKLYCNADWALFKEFGLAVPKDGNEYDCGKLQ